MARGQGRSVRRALGRVRARSRAQGRALRGGPSGGSSPRPGARAQLLLDSPLFDAEWYSLRTGATGDKEALVRHYLATPLARRVSPQPLFDPAWFARSSRLDLGGKDPFLVYLRRKPWGTPTHPAFSTVHYRRTAAGAKEHPHGPIGHYLEVGAPAGIPGNRWLPVDADGRGPDLRAWLMERHRSLAAKAAAEELPVVARRALKDPAPVDAELAARVADAVVDVVLTPGGSAEHVRTSVASLLAQSHRAWHLLVLDDETDRDVIEAVESLVPQGSLTRVDVTGLRGSAVLSRALEAGEGAYVAFLTAADEWAPDRLARLLVTAERDDAGAVADVMRVVREDGTGYLSRAGIGVGAPTQRAGIAAERLLLRRADVDEIGLDESLLSAWEFALLAEVAQRTGVPLVESVGVVRHLATSRAARGLPGPRRPVSNPREVAAWADVVLNDLLVDWDAAAEVARDPGVVSVVIPTYADWEMTSTAVDRLLEHAPETDHRLQVVVVDNGNDPDAAVMLDLLTLKYDCVEVDHRVTNLGYALGNNVAVPRLRGETVVFLNNDTEVQSGWLAPLVEALADDTVIGAQPLLLYPDATIQCAGLAFPSTGGLAHGFLVGFPPEDADGIEDLPFHAVTGACLAMRTTDVVALRGFDPIYTNGMEDVDLCLRAAQVRPGRFTVRPDSVVVHHESKTPGRHRHYAVNRRVFLERWRGRLPQDDVELWATRGFEVHGHALSHHQQKDRHLGVTEPVLVRRRAVVTEAPPRLRWALKNPAPATPAGDRWGDTHFAHALAEALRSIGQEVVIDRRDAFERPTGRHDDVNLVLRGLSAFWPTTENVTLGWVISHPEQLSGAEAATYDRVLAASVHWAEQQTRRWGIRVDPMLQATDHRLFHPDRAVPDTGHPVLFVGSARGVHRPMVRDAVAQGLPLSLYGTEWEKVVPRHVLKGTYLANADLGAAYRSAGVVLNDHWEDMRSDGFLSNRLFDAVASGARVLTDDVAGLGDLFGRSVQVVRAPEDLVRLSSLADPDTVFGDDDERRATAERIRREHSFEARARRLLEIALEVRAERGFDR